MRNHRVLNYNSPFTTDTIADEVWGQADFFGNLCNRVTNYFGPGGPPAHPEPADRLDALPGGLHLRRYARFRGEFMGRGRRQ